MGNFLYILATMLAIAWAIGFFALHISGSIHILIVMALLSVVWNVFGIKAIT
ncbi:MAG: DUF5670 family protein [Cytophagales bacterium]